MVTTFDGVHDDFAAREFIRAGGDDAFDGKLAPKLKNSVDVVGERLPNGEEEIVAQVRPELPHRTMIGKYFSIAGIYDACQE